MELGLSSSSVSTLRHFEGKDNVYQKISCGTACEHTENESVQLQTVGVICLPPRMDEGWTCALDINTMKN